MPPAAVSLRSRGAVDRLALSRARGLRRLLLAAGLTALAFAFWGSSIAPQQILIGRDTLELYLPLKAFMAQAFRQGSLPVWYPFDGLGFSIPGSLLAELLDPSNLLLLVMSPAAAVKWSVLLCYPLAATGGYYLGRALRLPWLAACAVGVAFAFSGYLASQSANLLYIEGAARLPWVLGAAERLARRARAADAAVLALAMASLAWCGDVETAALAIGVCAAILALRARGRRQSWTLAGAAGAVCLLLCAPLVGPAIAAYGGSTRAGALSADEALSWSLHPLRLPELLLGSPLQLHVGLGAVALRFGGQNAGFWSESIFLGAATVTLAVAGFSARRRGIGLYAVLAALALPLALGSYGHLYAHVPGLMHFRYPEKLLLWVSLGVAVGAGAGVARLARAQLPPAALAVALTAAVVAGLLCGLWLPGYHPRIAWAAGAIALLAVVTRAPSPRRRQLAAVSVLALELLASNRSLLHHGATDAFPHLGPPIAALRPGERICSDLKLGAFAHADGSIDARGFKAWALAAGDADWSGLYGLRSTLALTPTFPSELDRLCSVEQICADNCARMLGARYRLLAAPDAAPLLGGDLREVARWGRPELVALEDPHAPEHVSLRPVHVYSDPWRLEVALHRGELAPGDFAFVHAGTLADPTAFAGRGTVEELESSAARYRLRTRADSGAILALREAYERGWHALVDGRPVPVIPVNLGMVGLAIPAGEHRVELRFVPWTWPGAFAFYAVGWLALGVLGLGWRKRVPSAIASAATGPRNAHGQPHGTK